MKWELVKNQLEIQKIKYLLSISDYKTNELQLYLNKIINNIETFEPTEDTETFTNSEIIPKDISSLFKKPWNKLPTVHQIIKIKEYCGKISRNNTKRLSLEKLLIDKIKNKQLQNDQINYDSINGNIISISNINKSISI